MISGIYAILSPSGELYIGSSQNIYKRWGQHQYHLIRKTHHNRYLQAAWEKYKGLFEFYILLICAPKDLILYEQQFLDFYTPKYNISKYANRNFNALGVKRSEETKQKISQALLGKTKKGHAPTEAAKQKLSQLYKGAGNPMYGKIPWNKKYG